MARRESTVSGPEKTAAYIPGDRVIDHLRRLAVQAVQEQGLLGVHAFNDAQAAWLDTHIYGMFPGSGPAVTRAAHKLRACNYRRRRDVLVGGTAKVSKIPQLGKGGIGAISEALANDFGITWVEKPDMRDILSICANLSEVSSVAIAAEPLDLFLGSGLAGESVSLSVQDILETANGVGLVTQVFPTEWSPNRIAEVEAHADAARLFALGFYATQLSLQGELH